MGELNEEAQKVAKAIMNDLGYNLEEATRIANNNDYIIYYDCNDMTDIAHQIVEECRYLDNVPDNVAKYFDYEAYGRDLQIEGNFIFLKNERRKNLYKIYNKNILQH